METKFNFKSQTCTTREQSERLIALGLKKETADMVLCKPFDYEKHKYSDGCVKIVLEEAEDICKDDIPSWSLHRLMILAATPLELDEMLGYNIYDYYDNTINHIESLIKKGYFPKEYLV